MTKDKFLKELEKKLKVLTESEIKDIIDEYRDIIEEKIKHGKTEEEAVKEFGDINKLAKEILSAYKIDPEYNKNDNKNKTIVDDCEDLIKNGAKKLSEVTDEVVEGLKKSNMTTENIFEIIIKVILVLLGLAILKLPFYIISEIGSGIFNIGLSPLSDISGIIWKILIELIYVVVCILVVIVFISKYTNNTTEENKSNIGKKDIKKEESKEEKKTSKKKVADDTLGTFLLLLSKIFVVMVILLPIWMTLFGILIAISFIIYFIIKGVYVFGFLIFLLGITGILINISTIIYNLLFKSKKTPLFPILISFILIILGTILSIDYIVNLKYYDKLPNNLNLKTNKYEEVINENTVIPNIDEIIIDNNLDDYNIIIEVSYYDEYFKVSEHIDTDEENYISFNIYNNKGDMYELKKVSNLFIDNLRKNEVYNYSLLNSINIKVYANEFTKELIKND